MEINTLASCKLFCMIHYTITTGFWKLWQGICVYLQSLFLCTWERRRRLCACMYTDIHLKLCQWGKKLCFYVLRVYGPHLSARLEQTKASDLGWSYYKAIKCQIIFFFPSCSKVFSQDLNLGRCLDLTNCHHNGEMGMSFTTLGTCNTELQFVKCLESLRE